MHRQSQNQIKLSRLIRAHMQVEEKEARRFWLVFRSFLVHGECPSLSLSLYICVEDFLVVNGEEAGNSKSLFSLLPCFCLLLFSCILWLRVDWCHVNSTKCVSRAIICDGNVGFVAETRVDAAHRMFQLQRRINRFCSTTTA